MKEDRRLEKITTASAFAVAFIFFQFAYPYHLMRREQLDLFMYDGNYIAQTYKGAGWLARFIGDFFDQFLYFPVLGPVLFALMLTAIGVVAYRICRHFLNKGFSFAIAAVLFAWSFLRETGIIELTRYSMAVLCYLAVILGVLQLKKLWQKVAIIPILAVAVWAIGSPYHKDYGKLFNVPSLKYDKIIGMEVELTRGNWSKVRKLAKEDYHIYEGSYCYNLACAMEGELSENIFKYSQSGSKSLFLWVTDQESEFTNCLAGEVWFHLGDMTLAEQSAIVSLMGTPYHTGTKYLLRLAKVNMISGEDDAAQKYLQMLSKTLLYGKWARRTLAGDYDDETREWLESSRKKLVAQEDEFVYNTNEWRPVLHKLLEADPSNKLAQEYLLCYDLLRRDLDSFMEDYSPEMSDAQIYQEAVLIWLTLQNKMNDEEIARYRISKQNVERLDRFYRVPGNFKGTYWHYFTEGKR